MSKADNLCTQCFKYNKRFGEYEAYIEKRLQQEEEDNKKQLKLF